MQTFRFIDDQYPYQGVTHVREIARAICVNAEGKVAIHRIYRDDMFCKQKYYETPGGGVDEGETPELAVVREIEEEVGIASEVIRPICDVIDFYNLIGRENHNHFFLVKAKEEVGRHLESEGDQFIQETLWLPIDEAIALYEAQSDRLVAGIVKKRELPVLRLAKRMLQGE